MGLFDLEHAVELDHRVAAHDVAQVGDAAYGRLSGDGDRDVGLGDRLEIQPGVLQELAQRPRERLGELDGVLVARERQLEPHAARPAQCVDGPAAAQPGPQRAHGLGVRVLGVALDVRVERVLAQESQRGLQRLLRPALVQLGDAPRVLAALTSCVRCPVRCEEPAQGLGRALREGRLGGELLGGGARCRGRLTAP